MQRTALKCAGKGRGPLSWFNGVDVIDPESSTVRIEDKTGKYHKFFVSPESQAAMWNLQKGDSVSVSVGPVPGRVESIMKINQ